MRRSEFIHPVRTIAPTQSPVSLSEVKAHLRVDHDDEDGKLQIYIDACVQQLDAWTGTLGQAMVTQTWRVDYTHFCGDIILPFGPVQSVVVTYRDPSSSTQTYPAANYVLLHAEGGHRIVLKDGFDWPDVDDDPAPVSVSMVVGFGTAADVPASIKAGLLLMIGDLYANPESVGPGSFSSIPMSTTVAALLGARRRVIF
jgi:uncharacterized phiE125 gp8 family phage protein